MTSVPGVDARAVVRDIELALARAGLDAPAGQGGLELETVRIEMQTVAELELGLKPKFKVPVFGWEVGAEYHLVDVDTHTVDVTLRPPWAVEDEDAGGDDVRLKGLDVSTALPGVVESVRELLRDAASGPAHLALGAAELTFKFDATESGSIELAVPRVGRKRAAAITITFGFRPG